MAKKRQRQQVVALQKNNAPSTVIDSSNSGSDLDLDLDLQDSWVIVKRQIVKILIPPLPVANKSPPPNPEPVQQQPAPGEMVASESELPAEAFPKAASIQEQKKNKPLAPKRDAQLPRKYPPAENVPTFSKSFRRNSRTETQKAIIMRPRRFQHGPSIFFDQGVLLNQRLRARNLERKLQKAGGLSSWLESRGLGQFVRIFQRKGLSKFQLVNLTMKKLKDMGANAVGPRRKLMHAIDCFCQPCFY